MSNKDEGKYRFSRPPRNFRESRDQQITNVGYSGPITPAPDVRSTHGGSSYRIPSQAEQRASISNVVNINNEAPWVPSKPSVEPVQPVDQQSLQQLFMQLSGVYEPARYCDFSMLPVLIGTADQIVLQSSSSVRTFLFILNNDINATGATLFFACGQVVNGSGSNGVPLAVGASLFFDTVVPQNDVHLISTVPGCTALIMFGQKSIG